MSTDTEYMQHRRARKKSRQQQPSTIKRNVCNLIACMCTYFDKSEPHFQRDSKSNFSLALRYTFFQLFFSFTLSFRRFSFSFSYRYVVCFLAVVGRICICHSWNARCTSHRQCTKCERMKKQTATLKDQQSNTSALAWIWTSCWYFSSNNIYSLKAVRRDRKKPLDSWMIF